MGMAASQARYLGLTARKTNVEYEGQQVNQQRTALANQSANLFNQLMAVELPIPPSTAEFTKVQYSYNDGFNNEAITNWAPIDDGSEFNYLVTHKHTSKVYTGNQEILQNPQVYPDVVNNQTEKITKPMLDYDAVKDIYYLNNTANDAFDGTKIEKYDPTDPAVRKIYEELKEEGVFTSEPGDSFYYKDANGIVHFMSGTEMKDVIASDPADITAQRDLDAAKQIYDGYRVGVSDLTKYDPADQVDKLAIAQIKKDQPGTSFANAADGDIFKYVKAGKTYYVCKADLDASVTSKPTTDNQINLNQYTASELSKTFEKTERAIVERDGQGRISNIRFENSTATYMVNTEQVKDEDGYKDAFNKYTYGVELYEKQVEDLNTKTKVIQQQDRTLELRLKQLDTEQKALQTEMEAVAKVIQKNVETTFKTFS